MPEINSLSAMATTKLVAAVLDALSGRPTPEDFMSVLHDHGFYIVRIPEPEPIVEPALPLARVETVPAIAPAPRITFEDWMDQVRAVANTEIDRSTIANNPSHFRAAYEGYMTPRDAFEDLIPF